MRLIIDKREQDSEILDLLLERSEDPKNPFEIEYQVNTVGDYIWKYDDGSDTGIVIEAKGASTDLISSILSGHLDTQVIDLGQYPTPFLLLWGEFNWFKDRQRFNRKRFLAYWSSIAMRTGVKPIWFVKKSDFVDFIVALPAHLGKGEKLNVIATRHKGTITRLDPNMGQFYSLPSIGEKRAEELCTRYPSFFAFLQEVRHGGVEGLPMETYKYLSPIIGIPLERLLPLRLQLKKVPGIGEKTAEKICGTCSTWEEFYYAAIAENQFTLSQKIRDSVIKLNTERNTILLKAEQAMTC